MSDSLIFSELEKRGLVSLLDDAIALLDPAFGFGKRISNGDTCSECKRYAAGIPVDHEPDCNGTAVVRELIAARHRLAQRRAL